MFASVYKFLGGLAKAGPSSARRNRRGLLAVERLEERLAMSTFAQAVVSQPNVVTLDPLAATPVVSQAAVGTLTAQPSIARLADQANPIAVAPQAATLNDQVLAAATSWMGTQVGDGGCSRLVAAALQAAGAQFDEATSNWGTPVPVNAVIPGDVLQFEGATFQHTYPDGSWYTQSFPHHSAIVYAVNGSQITMLNQNVNGNMTVQLTTIDLNDLVSGNIYAYQPQAPALPPPAPGPATTLNAQVLAAATGWLGTQVGDGQCWTLVNQALAAAGANTSGDSNYVFGTPVALNAITPGDVLQFEGAHFQHTDPATGSWSSWDFPHHTAIVYAVNGSQVTLINQNVNGNMTVQLTTIDLNDLVSGNVYAYQPQAA
jgi:hypothetical protein